MSKKKGSLHKTTLKAWKRRGPLTATELTEMRTNHLKRLAEDLDWKVQMRREFDDLQRRVSGHESSLRKLGGMLERHLEAAFPPAPAQPRPVVCVDIDGVLCKNDWRGPRYFGPVIKGAHDFMRSLNAFADVIIHTSRCWSDDVTENMDERELVCIVEDWLNANGFNYSRVEPKPRCSAYVDDRGVPCCPQRDDSAGASYAGALRHAKSLTQKGT